MRGHEPIISMRLSGFKPRSVWLNLLPVHECFMDWAEHGLPDAEVLLDSQDMANMTRLDLRFVVGLPVYLTGPDDAVTQKAASACLAAGAQRVTAIYSDTSRPAWDTVVRVADIKATEVESWPQ